VTAFTICEIVSPERSFAVMAITTALAFSRGEMHCCYRRSDLSAATTLGKYGVTGIASDLARMRAMAKAE
jgi:hypothetical protein